MNETITTPRAFFVGLALLSASCAATSEKDSLEEVDNLVARIERVHVESELSKERVREAVELLHTIVSSEFAGDPILAYTDFVEAVERSEKQAEVFSDLIKPMKGSANKVFEKWQEDLGVFTSPGMRARSEERLAETRQRFDAIVTSVEPTAESFDVFNHTLRDHVLFLEHDFNPAAVAAIGGEVSSLTDHSRELDAGLDACMQAAATYVRSTALPGELVVSKKD